MKTNQFCNVMAVPTSLHDSETCALSHKRLQTTNCLGKVFFNQSKTVQDWIILTMKILDRH